MSATSLKTCVKIRTSTFGWNNCLRGRLRTDAPKQLAAACDRLMSIETAIGPDTVGMIEMLVLDRFTVLALQHETGGGLDQERDALARLTEAYGLLCLDQEAGRAFASS